MIEIIAVTFTLLSVILTIRSSIFCWPASIIGVTFYSIIFHQHQLYGDLILQGIFFIQAIIGWYNWRKPKEELKIGWVDKKHIPHYIISTIIIFSLVFLLSVELNGHLPILDSSITTLSIMATFLLIKKRIESWILWIINDILLIILFSINGLEISAWIYFTFLFLATSGLIKWTKAQNDEI